MWQDFYFLTPGHTTNNVMSTYVDNQGLGGYVSFHFYFLSENN